MPWEYSENMWKMATRNEWDELQYHSKEDWNDAYNNKQDTKHNNVNTNDDVDTSHFDDRVAHHNMHWACTHSFTVLDHHTHIHGSSWVLHLSPHLHVIHVCVGCFSLTRPTPLSTSQPSSCLSPSSTSATSSSRSSTRRTWKTCATVRAPTTSSASPQVMSPRPMLRRAPELISPPLLQGPYRGPGRGWPDTRQDAHWSVPRTSRLLRTRRRVSQSVVVVWSQIVAGSGIVTLKERGRGGVSRLCDRRCPRTTEKEGKKAVKVCELKLKTKN